METIPNFFNEGTKKILVRDYADAVTEFTVSLKEEPNTVAAYNNRRFEKKLNDTSG